MQVCFVSLFHLHCRSTFYQGATGTYERSVPIATAPDSAGILSARAVPRGPRADLSCLTDVRTAGILSITAVTGYSPKTRPSRQGLSTAGILSTRADTGD